MGSTPVSTWSEARFGGLAADLVPVVTRAIHTAHELALRAHLSGEMDHNDTYGHTIKVKMNQILAKELEGLPGVVLRKPAGGRFHLPVIEETSVALLPIRYSTDRQVAREDAKIDVSTYRRSLLALVNTNPAKGQQLSFEDSLMDDEDVDAHYQQIRDLDDQLAAFGQVATIGFGSNPTSGLWGLGWGDLRVHEDSSAAAWESWEALPEVESDVEATSHRPTLRSVPAVDEPTYFDQTDESDDLGLLPRLPGTGAASAEESDDPDTEGEASIS
jgi:hypothetical protein